MSQGFRANCAILFALWSAAARRRFVSPQKAKRKQKQSGVVPPHSKIRAL
jgi:hypothetical protein